MKSILKSQLRRQFSTLYTWGEYPLGTGQKVENESFSLVSCLWGLNESTSERVDNIDESLRRDMMMGDNGRPLQIIEGVNHISMGVSHSAIIMQNGKLFTSGNGNRLALGNDQVDYFRDIECVDVDCDSDYTVVLDKDGQVYAFGQGQSVQRLEINERVKSISAGKGYGYAITESNRTYTWGVELHGCHGDGMTETVKTSPTLNFRLSELLTKKNIHPVKIRNAKYSTMMLMNNNEVWACGQNDEGQLGLREVQGRITDRYNIVIKKISDTYLQGEQVLDIDLSTGCSLIMTKDTQGQSKVYVSGLNQNKKPFLVQNVIDPISICATPDCYYILQKDGQVVISHPYNCLTGQYIHPVSGKITVSNQQFNNKQPSRIGGNYGIHYALC